MGVPSHEREVSPCGRVKAHGTKWCETAPVRPTTGCLLAVVVTVLLAACGEDGEDDAAVTSTTASTTGAETEAAAVATRELFADIGPDEPGCSVAVARRGEVVFAEGAGVADLASGRPIGADTVFDMASVSKQMTATAVLLLAQQELLALDDTIDRWFPELPAWAADVSVAQLVNHTSGIPDYVEALADRGLDLDDVTTQADAVQAIAAEPDTAFEPGSAFEYSNANYVLLADLVERVTGSDLAAFLDAEVFGPLGLEMAMTPVADVPGKAVGYEEGLDGSWEPVTSRWQQLGDGAVMTTPTELVRWASEYWDPQVGGPELLVARQAGAAADGPFSYGAGIVFGETDDGQLFFAHDGGWAGFASDFVAVPGEQFAAAVACNAEEVIPPDAAASVAALWR